MSAGGTPSGRAGGADEAGGPVRVRVVIADDHPVVREGIRRILEDAADFEVVGEAADGREAIELTERLAPDVVLMDLAMPGTDGVAATERITAPTPNEGPPRARVLILTSFDDEESLERAVRAGAGGYLLKDAPREEIHRAVRLAARGEAALAPEVTGRLLQRIKEPPAQGLNADEVGILELVARGHSNKAIAEHLWVSVETVKYHLEAIRGKLGATDRTNAAALAAARGLIRPSGPAPRRNSADRSPESGAPESAGA